MTAGDEETGLNTDHKSNNNNNNNTNGDDLETTGLITGDWRKLTNVSLNSTNVSDSEYLDYVSEMSPLRQHYQHHTVEVAPLPSSYGGLEGIEASKHPLRRRPSDESINTVTALPGMVIRCHSINNASASRRGRGEGNCIIRPSTTKVALRAVQLERRKTQHIHESAETTSDSTRTPELPSLTAKESYWIDIETPQRSTDELYDFLNQLRLPSFFVSILSEPSSWTSEVVALKRVSLAIFQILPTDPDSDEITHVALLSMPRLLVTFSTFTQCSDSEGFYQLVSQYMKERERVPEPSNSGLLLAWLQFHVRRTARAIRNLRVATVEMDEALDRDYESFDFDDLIEAKNCLLLVLSVAEEQNKMIELLAVAEQSTEGLDFFNCIGAFSMLQANASSNERLSSRVDKHLNELRERIMSHREVTLNKRLALLTILSAIFMPLTLLSGIWGMNFKSMPELQPEGAYQKALIAMFSLAVIMVFCFRRSGFIDI